MPRDHAASSDVDDEINDVSQGTRTVHANCAEKNHYFGFPDNQVENTKYTWWNFIAKNLVEQFSLHINRYFLFIAVLQLFPTLTPVNPVTTWAPLIVIFGITATKEAIDDYYRAQEDKKANDRLYTAVRNGIEVDIRAAEIEVGDIVKIRENEEIPADMVLLYSSGKQGTALVQTANLDGETNFKSREALKATQSLSLTDVRNFQGVVQCAPPNKHVYTFNSAMWMEASPDPTVIDPPTTAPMSLSSEQLLQQTIRLVNTEWIYGLVVYTGNETKFGMNRGEPPFKYTKVDQLTNKVAVYVFVFQLVLVVILGIVGDYLFFNSSSDSWYFSEDTKHHWYSALIIPLRFLLLNSTMIPISLKVTMDLCKLIYSKFINYDIGLYDDASGETAYAKNTSISEDLGQIEYVLSDKTGTLTQNSMVFQQCCIGNRLFAIEPSAEHDSLRTAVAEGNEKVTSLLVSICLNSTVVPVQKDHQELEFKASSPDECALVTAAQQSGVVLQEREGQDVVLVINGKPFKYQVLFELKFSSDRKRMSVVVKDLQTDEYWLYCKGADEVVRHLLAPGQDEETARENIDRFAAEGLRTLFFGYRQLSEEEVHQFAEAHEKANTAVFNREQRLEEEYAKLEQGFIIQASTAIEDKLQEGVPETIQLMRDAGIKVWMLTGDKYSTALEIAVSCNLKSTGPNAKLIPVQGLSRAEISACLLRYNDLMAAKDISVIIRGATLAVLLLHEDLIEMFAHLCMQASTVICCRVTPSQKADLVELIRERGKMTLAVGDGGNDVAMIQQAHVGVGIRGKEGLQAARAADYNITYFRDLERLLLIHGRYSYLRTSLVAQYSYYKSLCFCFIQIFFAFHSFFSGATLFNSLCITVYNAALFVPIVTFVFDKDISFDSIMKQPSLYADCITSRAYNFHTFVFHWGVRGLFHAIVIFTFSIYSRGVAYHDPSDGSPSDWETLGVATFLSYLWVQALTMCTELHSLNVWNIVAIWGMHALTIIILIFTNSLIVFDSLNGFGASFVALSDPNCWLLNLCVCAACLVPVIATKAYYFNYKPTVIDRIRFIEAGKQTKGYTAMHDSPSPSSHRSGSSKRHPNVKTGSTDLAEPLIREVSSSIDGPIPMQTLSDNTSAGSA